MKYLLAFAFSICVFQVKGQENGFYQGARFGAGNANLEDVDLPYELEQGTAINFGYAASIQFLRWIGIDLGLHAATKQALLHGELFDPELNQLIAYKTEFNAVSINAPVLAKYRFGKGEAKVKLMAGASFNYLVEVGHNKSYSEDEFNAQYGFNDRKIRGSNFYEIEAIIGAGLEIPMYADGLISIDFTKAISLNSFGNIIGDDGLKFSNYIISFGLMYKMKK